MSRNPNKPFASPPAGCLIAVPKSNLPRARPPSGKGLTVGKAKVDYARFINNPVRLVAAIAADWMEDWKKENPEWRPPQRVPRESDGEKVSLYDAAFDHAVGLSQKWFPEPLKGRYPVEDPDRDFKDDVKELLRLGRTSWPGEDDGA
jgi:hypothetical protein